MQREAEFPGSAKGIAIAASSEAARSEIILQIVPRPALGIAARNWQVAAKESTKIPVDEFEVVSTHLSEWLELTERDESEKEEKDKHGQVPSHSNGCLDPTKQRNPEPGTPMLAT